MKILHLKLKNVLCLNIIFILECRRDTQLIRNRQLSTIVCIGTLYAN